MHKTQLINNWQAFRLIMRNCKPLNKPLLLMLIKQPLTFRTLDGDYGAPFISDHYPVSLTFSIP